MPAKDPRINSVVMTGRIVSAPETKTFGGGATCTKAKFEAMDFKKSGEEWTEIPIPIEVKAWSKTAEKLEKIPLNALVSITGALKCDHFEWQGKPCTRLYINVFSIGEIEWVQREKPKADDSAPPESEPLTEDDIPF